MALDTRKIDRASLWVLVAIIFFIVIGGALQLRSHLFFTERNLLSVREEIQANSDTDEESTGVEGDLENLQQQDTDGDGLNDFEEQYVYNTSIYLVDTDSDGASDFAEVQNGANPNCSDGNVCVTLGTADTTSATSTSTGEEAVNSQYSSILADNDGSTSIPNPDEITAEELRDLLVELGATKDDIAEVTDEQLLAEYRLAYEGQSSQGTVSAADAVTVTEEADRLRTMSTADKRAYLLESGISADQINSLSDAEVVDFFDSTLDEVLAESGVTPTN